MKNLNFYDIIPVSLILDCCNNRISGTITNQSICNSWTGNGNACSIQANNYCQGDNLLQPQCYTFCKNNQQNTTSNCSDNLYSYCKSGTAKTSDPNYDNVCSCFLHKSVYASWRNDAFSALDINTRTLLERQIGPVNAVCDYPNCQNMSAIQPQPCQRSQNIQNCIDQNNINVGNASGSPINASGAISCIQSSENGGGGSSSGNQNNSPPPLQAPKSNKALIIAIVIIVLLLIAIGMYFII